MAGGEMVHKFEAAGLGKAPFEFVGQEVILHKPTPESPARAGSTCDYCGTAIGGVFWVLSADGRRFKVGCDCIDKVGDAGLRKAVNQVKAAARREKQRMRLLAGREKLAAAIEANRETLAATPHPMAWAAAKGMTMVDYYEFALCGCGADYVAKLLKQIEIR